jgi:hypothetical protein
MLIKKIMTNRKGIKPEGLIPFFVYRGNTNAVSFLLIFCPGKTSRFPELKKSQVPQ